MTSIAIIGGTGYAGSHIAQEAAGRGFEVTAVSRSAADVPAGVTHQVGSLADAALVSAQGIAVMYTAVTGAEQTPANFVANGVGYVGAQSTSITDPTIAALHAVGIKVIGYTLDRQVDVAAWLARGGDGYFTNEPLYAAGASNGYAYQRTSMAFTAAYDHGEIENDTIGVRGLPTATAPAGIGWNDVAALGTRSMLLGPLSPAKGDPNANAFTFDFTYQWTSAANTGRWVGCFICCPTDAAVSGNGTDPAGADGYRCLITPTGLMEIAKYTNGANVGNLASASFSALTLPLALALRVTITPTTITFLDVTNSHSVSTNDTTYRGGFIHEAMSGCTARLIAASVS
jgi:hypothetical protein